MKRRSGPILRFALSIALLSVVAAWVTSHWRWDSITWTDSRRFIHLVTGDGRLSFVEQHWENGTAAPPGWSAASGPAPAAWSPEDDAYGRRAFAGFEWSDALWYRPEPANVVFSFHVPPYRLIAVPYWALAVLLALPLVRPFVRAQRRRSRLRRGRCPECAYDLRGTPAGCPECGWSLSGSSSPAQPAAPSAAAPVVPM